MLAESHPLFKRLMTQFLCMIKLASNCVIIHWMAKVWRSVNSVTIIKRPRVNDCLTKGLANKLTRASITALYVVLGYPTVYDFVDNPSTTINNCVKVSIM